ncbi:MAG TPA: DUF4416 family protein [Candidatus Omnitrophota bacterium]|nr:DUF4416 family protein [Candidatus Omnitrophota bacterium]HRZ14812.1 DUF4416 family protein [Candidatus Omnitrophota bacterium]
MGIIQKADPVKLIAGFIFKQETLYLRARQQLVRRFGEIDYESAILPFTLTHYYEKEFGAALQRAFVSFKKLIPSQKLSEIKIITNRIESSFCEGRNRTVNIDPGYVDLAKLVLASTKDYVHRIHLNKGIFAEITLHYQDKSFHPWTWTYPDYQTQEYIRIFNRIRELYALQIKQK